MHQTTQPKFRLFNYKKEKKKSFINMDPLLSPVNKKILHTQKNTKQSLMHSLNFITTNISPLGQHSKNKKINNSSNCTNSNLHLSKKTLNCKTTTSQFLNFKSLKPSNQNGNSSSKKNKNLLLNTLNLSTKNNFNLSLENYDNNNLEQKILLLQKEKDDLTKKNNSQKKLISKLINENEDNEKKLTQLDRENKKLKDKLSQLKENQNQLILLLKIIGKTGVDIEGIIDKWNEQVECNNTSHDDDDIEIFTTIKDKEVDESKIDSTVFVPITIDDEDKGCNTKINNHNVPKLNFDKLNKTKFKTLKNNNEEKNHCDEPPKNEDNNNHHQQNHSFSAGNSNKPSNTFKLKNFNIFHPKK